MKDNKGQVLIEFAMALPLLLLLVFGIMYTGMLFHDYSTLSALARSSTREAAIITESSVNGRYDGLEQKYGPRALNMVTSLYIPDPESPYIIQDTADSSVETVINMVLSSNMPALVRDLIPDHFTLQCYMRKEAP